MLLSIMDGSFRRFIGVSILIIFLNKNSEGASSNELRSKNVTRKRNNFSSLFMGHIKKTLWTCICIGIWYFYFSWLAIHKERCNECRYYLLYPCLYSWWICKSKRRNWRYAWRKRAKCWNANALCSYWCCNYWLLGRRGYFNLHLCTQRCYGILYVK